MCLSQEDLRDVQGQGFSNGALLMAFRWSGVTTVCTNFGEYIETLSIFYFGVKGIVFEILKRFQDTHQLFIPRTCHSMPLFNGWGGRDEENAVTCPGSHNKLVTLNTGSPKSQCKPWQTELNYSNDKLF